MYSEKSPINFRKSTTYSEKSTCNTMEGCDCGATNDKCFVKRSIYSQKSPKRALCTLKRALHTSKRALFALTRLTCNAMESCDWGATNDTCHISALSLHIYVNVQKHVNTLQHTTARCNTLQHTHCNILQYPCHISALSLHMYVNVDKHFHTLQHTVARCNTLQHTHCNTLQYTCHISALSLHMYVNVEIVCQCEMFLESAYKC